MTYHLHLSIPNIFPFFFSSYSWISSWNAMQWHVGDGDGDGWWVIGYFSLFSSLLSSPSVTSMLPYSLPVTECHIIYYLLLFSSLVSSLVCSLSLPSLSSSFSLSLSLSLSLTHTPNAQTP